MSPQFFKTPSLTLTKRALSSSISMPVTNTKTDPRYLYGQSPSVAIKDYEYEVDHLVIGAGVVGLAIAERLAARGGSTLLVEKNPATGQETR
jgi:hypothetical protein